ncbi:hypothetical protein D3C78_1414840 [compost metagenome]
MIGLQHLLRARRRKQYEGKLAALAKHAGKLQTHRTAQAKNTRQRIQDARLDRHQQHHAQQHFGQMGIEYADIQRHAHRDKKQPQQQPFERLDGDFQLVAIFAFGQQHAGDKGP